MGDDTAHFSLPLSIHVFVLSVFKWLEVVNILFKTHHEMRNSIAVKPREQEEGLA